MEGFRKIRLEEVMFRQCLKGRKRVIQERMEEEAFVMKETIGLQKLETLDDWLCSQPSRYYTSALQGYGWDSWAKGLGH